MKYLNSLNCINLLFFRIARVGKKESDEDTDKEDEDDDWTFVPEKRSKIVADFEKNMELLLVVSAVKCLYFEEMF